MSPLSPRKLDPYSHERLQSLFLLVFESVRQGQPAIASEAHGRFMVAFESHMGQEEEVLFPVYVDAGATPGEVEARAREVEDLRRQHGQLRALAGEIAVRLREGQADVDLLTRFELDWARHDDAEASGFHAWCDASGR